MILVDSNIWISAWKGDSQPLRTRLETLIESGEASINPLILTELLQGATNKKHQSQLHDFLDPVPILQLPENIWVKSAELFLELKTKGITPTTIDCLLATQCLLMNIPLFSLDHIFSKMAKVRGLKIHTVN